MKEIIHTNDAPKALGPYSQAVKVNNMLYTAGQIAIDPRTGDLKISNIQEEMSQVMNNLGSILKAGGSSFDNVIKTTIFLSDMELYSDVNSIYATYFADKPPARSTVEVARLPKDVNVEIEFVASTE